MRDQVPPIPVPETESTFDDAVLGVVPVVDLLTEPVYVLADRWRH